MELVRAQARGLLEAASTSTVTEEKKEKISQLVEIATFRADSELVEEIVSSVCENVSDRTKAVRRSVLDFVEAVCLSDKATELCATKGLEAAAFLAAGEGSSALATKALRCSSRMLGLGRFARRRQQPGDEEIDCLDAISRERLVGALKEEGDDKFGAAAAECCLAVLLRDADFDSRGNASKKARASEKTKNAATAMASAIAELSGDRRARALDAAAVALATAFGLVHKVLVAAVIAALETDSDAAAVRCAVSALHSAETARRHQTTSQGILAAASARLEAALRRAGRNDVADEALEAARNGLPLGSSSSSSTNNKKRSLAAAAAEHLPRKTTVDLDNLSSPASIVFALAREDRLAMILEALDEEELPPPPASGGTDDDSSPTTSGLALDLFQKALDSAVSAALQPPPEKKRRARDPRTRRERPKQQPVQVVDEDAPPAMTDAKEVAADVVEDEAMLLEDALDDDEEVTADQAGTLTSDSVVLGTELSEKQEQFMRRIALERLAEAKLDEPSLRETRDTILARLARHELEQKTLDPVALRQLWDSVDFDDATTTEEDAAAKTADEWKAINAARCDAALKVLFESYATRDLDTYDALIAAIIPSLIHSLAKGGVNERTLFTETLCAVPRLAEASVRVLVDSSCLDQDEDEENEALSKKKVSLGLSALQFIALGRPKSRASCCQAVLELTRRPDVSAFVRYQAVRVAANLLFPVVAVQPYIRDFAVRNASTRLTNREQNAKEEENGEGEKDEIQELTVEDAARELALLFAVSIKDLQLVRALYDVVADAKDDTVRQALEAEFARLNIATLFAANHGCQQLLTILAAKENRTPAYDALVVKLVELLGDIPLSRRGKGLWAGVDKLVEACGDDDEAAVKFLAPALNDANAEQFQSVLPRLLKTLDDEQVAKALKGAAAAAEANNNSNNNNKVAKENILDAAQVLVALHRVQGGVPLKRVTKVLSVSLAARETFGAVTLRDALDRMLAVPPNDDTQDPLALAKSLPQLLMYTAILAVKMYPSQLSSFVANTVLTRLIVRFAVWHQPQLWKGVIMCADLLSDENGPNCFPALVQLPAPQLAHLLKVSAKLKIPFKRFVEKEVARNRSAIAPPILRLVGVRPVVS